MNKRTGQQAVIADEQIIEMYWTRDEQAIKETDNKYGQFLFRIAYNILHDSLDCEECQNDTYLGVWNAIPPTRPNVFQAFITQIMRRIAINRYKEKTSKRIIKRQIKLTNQNFFKLNNMTYLSQNKSKKCFFFQKIVLFNPFFLKKKFES